MVLQQTLASYNAWYLIILGLVAIAIALWSRRGLWGLVDEHLHVRLFPVGYWLWPSDAKPPASRLLSRLRRAGPNRTRVTARRSLPAQRAGPRARRVAGVSPKYLRGARSAPGGTGGRPRVHVNNVGSSAFWLAGRFLRL